MGNNWFEKLMQILEFAPSGSSVLFIAWLWITWHRSGDFNVFLAIASLVLYFPIVYGVVRIVTRIIEYITILVVGIYSLYQRHKWEKECRANGGEKDSWGSRQEQQGQRERQSQQGQQSGQSQQGQQNGQTSGGGSFGSRSDFEVARALAAFQLTMPFTEAELKRAYRQVMKKVHPDAGGSEEKAKKINAYYEMLKVYASGEKAAAS